MLPEVWDEIDTRNLDFAPWRGTLPPGAGLRKNALYIYRALKAQDETRPVRRFLGLDPCLIASEISKFQSFLLKLS
jgi:hypothetical protein